MEQKSTLVCLICFSYLVCFRSNRKYTNNKAISSISRGIHCDIRKENSRRTKRKQQLERAAYEINTHIEHRVPTAENCNKCNRYSLETMTSAMADSTWTHFMASKSKKNVAQQSDPNQISCSHTTGIGYFESTQHPYMYSICSCRQYQ